jgi:hypothetical protein
MFKTFFMRLERRVVVTLAIVLSMVALCFFLFDVKIDSIASEALEPFQVAYVANDTLQHADTMNEQWQLLDSMPLFAPTKWNASQRLLLEHRYQIEQNYAYYEPDIQLDQFIAKTNWDLASRDAVVKEANELFTLRNRYFVDHFLTLQRSAQPLSSSLSDCRIDVTAPDGSRTTKVFPYPLEKLENLKDDMDPIHCTVRYQSGMPEINGSLALSSSGDTAFDAFSESWIRLNFIAEFADKSGLYVIRIYPPFD